MKKLVKSLLIICILYSFSLSIFGGINFSSQSSKVLLTPGGTFNIGNPISGWSGNLTQKNGGNIQGATIVFEDGIFKNEESSSEITGVYNPSASQKVQLNGDQIIQSGSGLFLNKINVFGVGNKLQGPAVFDNSDSIRLEHADTQLNLSIQSSLNSDIQMRGGKIILDSDLNFADDRIFTGSGNVDLAGYSIYFGGKRDLNLTHSIIWENATDVNLTSKIIFSGNWVIDGSETLNGHGNIFDLSSGGTFYIGHNSTLNLTDIVIKGVGIDKGWFVFQDNTSTMSLSNVTFELDNRFTVSVGKIFTEGPTTIILKDYDFTLNNNSTFN
ncbi:hypothetical protein ACFLYH_02325 [Candidatus Dependentiae bacterium]